MIEAYHNKELVVIDVRTSLEFIHGHIENACNLPLEELNLFIEEIKNWQRPVITCSANGYRSEVAYRMLQSHKVKALDGGNWQDLQELLKEHH